MELGDRYVELNRSRVKHANVLAGHILLEGQRRKAKDPSVKWAVVTMCIGGGQGAAGLFEIF